MRRRVRSVRSWSSAGGGRARCSIATTSSTRRTSPQPWRSALATSNNGKHHARRARLNFQPQQFLDPVPQLLEHRHRKAGNTGPKPTGGRFPPSTTATFAPKRGSSSRGAMQRCNDLGSQWIFCMAKVYEARATQASAAPPRACLGALAPCELAHGARQCRRYTRVGKHRPRQFSWDENQGAATRYRALGGQNG
jgi:hypothetical protein